MEPSPADTPAPPSPHGLERKSPLGFFALVLLLYFLPGILAQSANALLGLAWSQLFVFLLPAAAAAAGSNLGVARFLLLAQRPSAAQVLLAAAAGAASFFVAGALMALAILVLPDRWVEMFDLTKLFKGPMAERVALALVASLLAPFCEEVAFRGYLQNTLLARAPPARAIATSAVLFAAMHLDPVRLAPLLGLGALFGWLSWRSGSIWPAVAAHVTNNGVASLLAVSGKADAAAEQPDVAGVGLVLALGLAALVPLALAFRRAAPSPPPLRAAVALRDPRDLSLAFRVHRVPTALFVAAIVGAALLAGIAVKYPIPRGGAPAVPAPGPSAPTPVESR